MKKEAVALCRVSTAEQRVDGNSLESQQKHVYDFVHSRLGCEIDHLWSLDVSSKAGKNVKRKDLEEIRKYCKDHRYIKYFIVDKVNRLMREITMFYWFIAELEMIGVKTLFADPKHEDLNKQNDKVAKLKLFLEIFGAESDNQERAETTITRMKDKYLSGYRLSNPLQGYKKSSTRCLFVPDEPRFTLLQTAMKNIISGRETVSEALVSMTNQGYRTPTGKILRIDRFKELLVNDFYAGLITVKKWKDDERFVGIRGLHKAMIMPDEHRELISIVLGKKRIFERKKDNKELPLGNIGICECRGKLVGFYHRNGKGWKKPKYRCCVCGKQLKAVNVHLSLDDRFRNIKYEKKDEKIFVDVLNEVWKEEESSTYEKIHLLENKVENIKLEKNQIVRKMVSNQDPAIEGDLKSILEETKKQIDDLETEIIGARKTENDLATFVDFSLKFLSGKMPVWKQLDRDKRIKCKQLAFPGEIIVNFSEKVYTPQISPILSLICNKKELETSPNSLMVEVEGVAPSSKRLKTYFYSKFELI